MRTFMTGQINQYWRTSSRVVYDHDLVETMVLRLADICDEADTATWQQSAMWYPTYGAAITARGALVGYTPAQSVAAFAVLSAQMRIDRNWDLFDDLLSSGVDSTGVTGAQRDKLIAITTMCETHKADPAYVLRLASGSKVNAFAWCLYGVEDTPAIDRHAYHAATGERLRDGQRIADAAQRHIMSAYMIVADAYGISRAQGQALPWLATRGGDQFMATLPDKVAAPLVPAYVF